MSFDSTTKTLRGFSLLFLAFTTALAYAVTGENVKETAANVNIDNLCGVSSIYLAAKCLGVEVQYKDILDLYQGNGKSGIDEKGLSLAQVEEGLGALGLKYNTYNLNLQELGSMPGTVAITHGGKEKAGHFYISRVLADGRVQIVNPPLSTFIVTPDNENPTDRHPVILVGRDVAPVYSGAGVKASVVLAIVGAACLLTGGGWWAARRLVPGMRGAKRST
jgi:hypothetical protein